MYLTFISRRGQGQLFQGAGAGGPLLAERAPALPLHDLSGAARPLLWACGWDEAARAGVVLRVSLPDLAPTPTPWPGQRVGAVASEPDGRRALALALPAQPDQLPELWLWDGQAWQPVAAPATPDSSSKLAWIGDERIAYETSARQLAVLDLATGAGEIGPAGCCPAAAPAAGEWYAVGGEGVLRFPADQPFAAPPLAPEGFAFGQVSSLRLSADGQVAAWTQPRLLYRVKGYWQERGRRKRRLRELDDGLGAVLGPYTLT